MISLFRKLCLVLILLSHLVLKSQNKACVITGKIENPTSDSLFLSTDKHEQIYGVKLGKGNIFKIKIELKEGYYRIGDKNENTKLFLSPGFNLYLTIDTKLFDETVKYKGKGASENNFLAKYYLLDEGFGELNSYSYYAELKESAFLKLSDSLLKVELELLENYKKSMLTRFYEFQKMKIEYSYKSKLNNYESMHKMLTNDMGFVVSSSFPDPFKDINLNNAEWVNAFEYTNVVEAYLHKMASKDIAEKSETNYFLAFYKNMEALIKLPYLREKFAFSIGRNNLIYTNDLDLVYERTISNITDTAKIELVKSIYKRLKALQDGTLVPEFEFANLKGEMVKLSDFKGRFVYIDIWATWCGPCMYEMPYLRKLEDTLSNKNITFISICKDDYKENWERSLKNSESKSIQLFAEEGNDKFFKDFIVSAIPRFILLDKDGKIINSNAKRPSDPALLSQLELLLK